MSKPINEKCLKCSSIDFHGVPDSEKPDCWIASKCTRKRNYYRYLDKKRAYELKYHHYNRYRKDKCMICFTVDKLQSHHIIPQLIGGLHTKENVMTLCAECHGIITKYYQSIRGINKID